MDYSKALTVVAPDGGYVMVGNSYEGLTWLNDSAKPTDDQLHDAYAQYEAAEAQSAAAAASGRSKLAALGLTEAEISALVG